MRKKILVTWLLCLCGMFLLAGCGSSNDSEASASVMSLADEASSNTTDTGNTKAETGEMTEQTQTEETISELSNDLSDMIGKTSSHYESQIETIAAIGSFKYCEDDCGKIIAAATDNPNLTILGISPCTKDEEIIETLLKDQWIYKAEYIWYALNDESQHCYSSGIYEKDNLEIVLTMDAETESDNVIILEIIDQQLLNDYAEASSKAMTERTAFAYLHHID